jgi:hypothetical protein
MYREIFAKMQKAPSHQPYSKGEKEDEERGFGGDSSCLF